MSNNMASDRFLCITTHESSTINLRYDLICNQNCNTEFIRDSLQLTEVLCKGHLPCRQLSTTSVICPIKRSGRVYDHEGKFIFHHQCSSIHQELFLLVSCVGSSINNIIENLFGVQTVSFSNGYYSLRPKGSFGVDVHRHSCTTSVFHR